MQIKLAREDLKANPKSVSVDKIIEDAVNKKQTIFYFDRTNAHKDLIALVEKIESANFSVYLREVKYGLDEQDYMYEVNVV